MTSTARMSAILALLAGASVASAGTTLTGSYTFAGNTTPTNQVGPWTLTAAPAIVGPPSVPGTFSLLRFVPTTAPVFADVDHLSYGYNMITGGIAAGTPRATFVLDFNNDNVVDGSMIVHWGPAGSFADPTLGNGLNTGNLIGLNDLGRWDLGGIGGSAYTDYAAALAAAGSARVLRVSLTVDTFDPCGNREIEITSVTLQAVPAPGAAAALLLGGVITGRRRRN